MISSLRCTRRCANVSASSRIVGVRPGSVIVVIGRRLDDVRYAIFLGGRGGDDNAAARVPVATRLAVALYVPRHARSGRIVLVDRKRNFSPPSPAAVSVTQPQGATGGAQPGQEPSGGGSLMWPLRGPITSPYGPRWGRMHTGIDIGAPAGTPIRAAASGRVIHAGWTSGYGNFICIAHSTLSTCYAHLSAYLTRAGASVSRGQAIGRVGCTGNCTGDHLHFEVRRGTRMWAQPDNPVRYLPARSSAASSSAGPPQDWGLPAYGPGS